MFAPENLRLICFKDFCAMTATVCRLQDLQGNRVPTLSQSVPAPSRGEESWKWFDNSADHQDQV